MWCKICSHNTNKTACELCGSLTDPEIPIEIFWCSVCAVPVIKSAKDINKKNCAHCNNPITYLCADLRPVFPEERLLFEIMHEKPLAHINDSVWANDNRYYINGKSNAVTSIFYRKFSPLLIREQLEKYSNQNSYTHFNEVIKRFIEVNKKHLVGISDEARAFIAKIAFSYTAKEIVISFSGGKDSTVVADLVVRGLSDPGLVHIFGDTTLEFPATMEYADRFRQNNPKSIFKVARNSEQNFYDVCNDIGPPARMLRWCCSMFKTGPITRTLNRLYGDKSILTFYGVRKYESVSRSRYSRIEGDTETIKIQKQRVASPVFLWKDIDIWLYILGEGIDFNSAYRLGYDRVGCWCCPNNNLRAQFLSGIYMPEQSKQWKDFLVGFAKRIGKLDAEEYVDSGAWKARQGGNGVEAASDVKIRFANCTTEENAKLYQLNKPIEDNFIELFVPFGRIASELGRKLIKETMIVDILTNVPILSIQPLSQGEYEHSVKIKTMNVSKHGDLHRMVGYQIKKYNACRKCLKCESLCRNRAISMISGEYRINEQRCNRCKMCVTAKYIEGGCLMEKYLKTKG
ncbi:MAG: phosphoadenosine phosphosulfate reductase family protein [Defluviitaleaceae bacterium]|nr:phosphoadenosine phosphosulfate reductase family protein [Defluviitaleaceae bacterium]